MAPTPKGSVFVHLSLLKVLSQFHLALYDRHCVMTSTCLTVDAQSLPFTTLNTFA